MRKQACAYCGKAVEKTDSEHVIPKCLYPLSRAASKIQRLTIPACKECNNSWSDDEAHFRNMLLIAGQPNPPVRELWDTSTDRSFKKVDGKRRLRDLQAQMRKTGSRHMVYPGEDPKVIRIIRKIIRGLCYHHRIASPVADKRVWADVLKYVVPPAFLSQMHYDHREKDIFEYRYEVIEQQGIQSWWLLTFFEQRKFIGMVSMSEDGFPELEVSSLSSPLE